MNPLTPVGSIMTEKLVGSFAMFNNSPAYPTHTLSFGDTFSVTAPTQSECLRSFACHIEWLAEDNDRAGGWSYTRPGPVRPNGTPVDGPFWPCGVKP